MKFPFEMAYFQGRTVTFREGISNIPRINFGLGHCIGLFPQVGMKIKQYLKPPPSDDCTPLPNNPLPKKSIPFSERFFPFTT